jgi:hypothetical protein
MQALDSAATQTLETRTAMLPFPGWRHQVITVFEKPVGCTQARQIEIRTGWPIAVNLDVLKTLVLESTSVMERPASVQSYKALCEMINAEKCRERAAQMQVIADSMHKFLVFRKQAGIALYQGLQRSNSVVVTMSSELIRAILTYM